MGGCARAPGLFGGLARRVHTDAPAALARLVGTNAPALRKLELPCSCFVEADFEPLLAALPHNTHLQVLNVSHSGLSQPFEARLRAAARRANPKLKVLTVVDR